MEQLFFYLFATLAVAAALGVITMKNPVPSAVCLIICLLQLAALYVLLRAPFLAAVQVFIYVGAVMVLFLFAVMMLDLGRERLKEQIHGQWWVVLPIIVCFLALGVYLIIRGELSAPQGEFTEPLLARNTEVIGKLLYTQYIFPFEVVSVLLLVALVGAIVLVTRDKGGS